MRFERVRSRARLAAILACAATLACSGTRDAARAPEPTGAPGADASLRSHPGDEAATKHLDFDELDGGMIAPRNHRELLWGEYLDRDGKPAVGWHSHDPDHGNAL